MPDTEHPLGLWVLYETIEPVLDAESRVKIAARKRRPHYLTSVFEDPFRFRNVLAVPRVQSDCA